MGRVHRIGILFAALAFSALTAQAADTQKTEDKNKDGRIDAWYVYDANGRLKKTARDSNNDGKPDLYRELIKGRMLVLKSSDRNFDGRIDKRTLDEWKADKTITTYLNNRAQKLPNPGYVPLWTEEDNDYDGKTDVYKERGNKNPPRDKIGRPIDTEVKF